MSIDYTIPGIYNALDSGYGDGGMQLLESGVWNQSALQGAVNAAVAAGGGIVNSGTLTVTSSTVSGNSATGTGLGGGIAPHQNA